MNSVWAASRDLDGLRDRSGPAMQRDKMAPILRALREREKYMVSWKNVVSI